VIAGRSPVRLLAVGIAVVAIAACGDDSDSSDPAAAVDAAVDDATDQADTVADDGADEQDTSDGASDEASANEAAAVSELFDILDATYLEGTASVDVSGDADLDAEYSVGGGFTEAGSTSLTFTDDRGVLGIAIDGTGFGGISFYQDDFATGGTFPDQCDIEVAGSDASAFTGEFSCEGVPAVNGTVNPNLTVDISGTFSVSG
jgi:hypothetical protein